MTSVSPLICFPFGVEFGSGNGQRTGRLEDRAGILKHVLDGCTHGIGVDEHDFIHIFFADAQRFFPGQLDRRAVCEQTDVSELHTLSGFERTIHGIRIGGLHADDFDVRDEPA